MKMAVELNLPLPPNLGNARLHWAKKNRQREGYLGQAFVAIRNLRLNGWPGEPHFVRVEITPWLFVGNRMDPDNAIARLKWPIDALVLNHVIADDTGEFLTLHPVIQTIDRARPRLVFRIVGTVPK